jgi:4-azaleucine resistance transporter AzlC
MRAVGGIDKRGLPCPAPDGYYSCMIPHSDRPHSFRAAFAASLPVLFGYISIGFAYGFLLVKAGFHWLWAPVSGIAIFAGAAQFLSIGMLSSGRSIPEMFLAVLLINARHMVYGFSLLERFEAFHRFKAYLIFGLTDETYGLLTTVDPPPGADAETFDVLITGLNQSYWVTGSTVGALFGSMISWDAPGIEFSMTALFTVLLVEQIRSLRRPGPFLLALAVCAGIYAVGLQSQALLLGIVISAVGVFFLPVGSRNAAGAGPGEGAGP